MNNSIAGVWVKASERLPELQKKIVLKHIPSGILYFGNFDRNEEGVWLYIHEQESHKGWTIEDKGYSLSHWQWLDESPIHVNPIDIPEIPVHVKKILDMRNAIVQEDYDEVYHILYSIACPNFDKLEPWEELERKVEWKQPVLVNQDEIAEFREWMVLIGASLKELVELKKLKDSEGKTESYEYRQPRAWQIAFGAVELFEKWCEGKSANGDTDFLTMQFPGKSGSDIHAKNEQEELQELQHILKINPEPIPVQEGLREGLLEFINKLRTQNLLTINEENILFKIKKYLESDRDNSKVK